MERAIKHDRMLSHNAVMGAGSLVAGVVGLAFQVVVSHRLQPSEYGAVFAAIAAITLLSTPASAFALLMAREASRDRAAGHSVRGAALLSGGSRTLVSAGLVGAVFLGLLANPLAAVMNVPAAYVFIVAAALPFAWSMPLLLGAFQGEQHFTAFAVLTSSQAILKLIAAVVLGFVLGPVGVVAGIAVATGVVWLAAAVALRGKLLSPPQLAWFRPAMRYLALILPSTIALAILLNADVLVVKHFFSAHDAGEYSAVAALSRAIYWGATAVAGVLFPKVVYRYAQGHTGLPLVAASLFLVAAGAFVGFVLLDGTSSIVLKAFAGNAYAGGAALVPWYAIAMSFLGGSAVLIATHQSHARAAFLGILIPVAIVEPLALVIYHPSLLQVVQVVDFVMGVMFLSLAILYFATEKRGIHATHPAPVATMAVELQPNR
jgi:O-antigen/teichoic acid export membrane protein